jgi:G3E family GTPase
MSLYWLWHSPLRCKQVERELAQLEEEAKLASDSHNHDHDHGHDHKADAGGHGHDHDHGHDHKADAGGHSHDHDHVHHKAIHDDTVSSASFVIRGAMDLNKLNMWLGALLELRGDDIYRMKGILNIQHNKERFVFQVCSRFLKYWAC